ncbi:MAG: molybdenum cofactor guanylyltransferase [Gammaproteobacteria bacterium]|jgi:molybdopterin-guanine dinucleotide biosynthesis protein A|nr:molybdenum cofactor guanylyltransferase [Gammaproteobacteria bacterium]
MKTTPDPTPEQITGLVLAGGAGRRMGGADKGLIEIAGKPLVQWVADALRPQTTSLLISANRNLEHYRALGYSLVTDRLAHFQGPLAGIVAALECAPTPWLLCSPCDTPLLPHDLGARLATAIIEQHTQIAIAADAHRRHPLHALIPCAARDELQDYLARGGRSVFGWLEHHKVAITRCDDPPSAFSNLNRPEQAATIRSQLQRRSARE